PYGAHVCEVEVDRETGALELVRYTAVDDVGRAINPLIVDGQTHGGAAQGIGQALGSCAPMMRMGNYWPVRSWVTPYPELIFCHRSRPISARCRRRQIGWVCAAPAKAARPARSAPSPMQ